MIATGIPVLPELPPRLTSYVGIPLREDSTYTNAEGRDDKGIRKRGEKALESIQEILRKVLEADEAVFYCASAQKVPGVLEQLVLGWAAAYTGFGLLVLTNRRLFYFSMGKSGGWQKGLRMTRWGDIQQAKVSGFIRSKLRIRYQNGTSEGYWKIRGGDGKKIKQLLALFQGAGGGEVSPAQGMTSVCPDCLKPLTLGVYECSQCHLRFKDERSLMRRALLIPGGGYFYVGYPGLGVLSLLGEGAETVLCVTLLIAAVGNNDPAPLVIAGLLLMLIVFLHKFVAIRHGRRFVREFIPLAN